MLLYSQMHLTDEILAFLCFMILFSSLSVNFILRCSTSSKEPFSINIRIRAHGHRWEGNLDCVLRISDWVTLFTCSSSMADHSLRCSRSEMSSFSNWLCWTSSFSALAKSCRVFISSSSNFCSSLCSSLSRMLLSWLNSVCILCFSACIWFCKGKQEREVMSLSAWEPTVKGIRRQKKKFF